VTSSFLYSQIRSAQVEFSYTIPTPITSTATYVFPFESCVTSYPGLTTLCDGYPRASDCIAECTTTQYSTSTQEYVYEGVRFTTIDPTWATEIDELVAPTCTVAPDLSPECARLAEAYSWRVSQIYPNTTTLAPYESPWPPMCSVLVTPTDQPTPPAKPKCSLRADSYEAFYWPKATPSNSNAFCNYNVTTPTGTPTIPGHPNTAVISGVTLTSPSVYHFLHNVTILTVQGRASSIGSGSNGQAAYNPSQSLSLFTLAQPPSSILSQTKECHKPSPHGATRCTISFHPDFLIQDLFTVNAKNYYGEELATPTTATICQASYSPTIALDLQAVAAQNKIGQECEWTWEHSGRTSVIGPDVITFSNILSGAYHAITTGEQLSLSTGLPRPEK